MKTLWTVLLAANTLYGGGPATWELSQFADFAKGKLTQASLRREGVLAAGPGLLATLSTGEASLWSAVTDSTGNTYLGTGSKGRVYVHRAGADKLELLATLPAPHIFALAVDAQGIVYAAGSPGGVVYQLGATGPKPYANTGAKFLWSLLATPQGLFAGGGDDGRVYRLTPGSNTAEVYFESGQTNITSLALDASGALLAGSDPNGLLYRITAKGKAQVLYDAPFTEIRSILNGPAKDVYFLAMGGVASRRAPAANQPPTATGGTGIPQVTTTITVTEDAQAGVDLKPKSTAPAATATAPTPVVSSTLDIPGLDRSAIYRLNGDGSVDSLFVTKEESIFDIALHEGKLHFASDNRGRVYALDGDRAATLLAETGEPEIGRLVAAKNAWLAVSTTAANLLRIGTAPAYPATFESPVHEAANTSRWGVLQFVGTGSYRAETRSGNSSRPDSTWSEWQPLDNSRMISPAARYAQWRIRATQPFEIRAAILNYLPRNQPPVVKSITAALTMIAANAPKAIAQSSSSSSVYTLTVTETGEATGSSSAGTAALLPTRPVTRNLMLSWVAEDPDSDTLQYQLQFRAEDETEWKPLKAELAENNFNVDADTLADGRYLFRVLATDAPSNSTATARTAELVSVPVQLDQTAPSIEASWQQNTLRVRATDTASAIRRLEYSLNAGRWQALDAADEIYDSRDESATLALTPPAGESVITVRAFDAALNVALKKIVVRR
jgi:hypothetical protein